MLACLAILAGCGAGQQDIPPPVAADGWHDFSGTWTAAGDRTTIRLGDRRVASVATLRGTLLLAGPTRPGIGFRSEAIVLTDTTTGMTGRAVWTDEHGDHVYSELKGEGTATGNRIVGLFVGGTGRYREATGTYAFSWRFVVEGEDGTVQGQSVGLAGRIRRDGPATSPATAVPRQ